MPSLEYFLVAEDLAVDQTTNRLSLFNVLDSFQAARFPLLIPKCAAVALWKKEAADEGRDFQSVVRITTSTGETHQVETNFRMTTQRHRIMNRLQGMAIRAAGDLRFELLLNGEHTASHVVLVEARPLEELPPA